MKVELWIALGGLLISSVVSLGGFVIWFSNSEKKKYAAEASSHQTKMASVGGDSL